MPEENLQAADVGTVVEHHDIAGVETGYSIEFFDILGRTVAIVTLPDMLRAPTHVDRPTVRSGTVINHYDYT